MQILSEFKWNTGARSKKLKISLLHVCDAECKEFIDTDCPFDKWEIEGLGPDEVWKFRRCPKLFVTQSVELWFMAYRMFKRGYLPNGNAKGWLHESAKFVKVMLFIEDLTIRLQKEEQENGERQRSNNNA